jgi:hypothetical protein
MWVGHFSSTIPPCSGPCPCCRLNFDAPASGPDMSDARPIRHLKGEKSDRSDKRVRDVKFMAKDGESFPTPEGIVGMNLTCFIHI